MLATFIGARSDITADGVVRGARAAASVDSGGRERGIRKSRGGGVCYFEKGPEAGGLGSTKGARAGVMGASRRRRPERLQRDAVLCCPLVSTWWVRGMQRTMGVGSREWGRKAGAAVNVVGDAVPHVETRLGAGRGVAGHSRRG